MYKLVRFFNQNRKKIIKVILIIVFLLLLIKLMDYFVRVNNENKIQKNNTISNVINDKSLVSDKSLISGETVKNNILEESTDIISKFIDYCNNNHINEAYDLLTEECKEEMFPVIDDFYNIYYSGIFSKGKVSYTIENWTKNIYQVRFTGDIMSTGKLNSNETKQDYITIIKENGENKLNINNYIGRKELKKTTEYEDISITVASIDTYMDYEIYNLDIENKSKNKILLDTSDDTKSIYLLDSNDMKYYFYSNEVVENKLEIQSKFKTNLKIKFSNSYSSSRMIDKLVFSKLVLNYDEYKDIENKDEYRFFKFVVNI